MTKCWTAAILALVALAAVLLPVLRNGTSDAFAPAKIEAARTMPRPAAPSPSRHAAEDPFARRNWELQRLRDPATGSLPLNIHAREREFAKGLPVRSDRRATRDGTRAKSIPGWHGRGPVNVGGRTRALALDMSDPSYSTLLAGGVSGGLWRSTDAGASWTLTSGSTQLQSVSCVAQDTRPGHQSTWYYGTGEWHGNSATAPGASFRGDGIFKSTDGGQSWNVLPSTSTGDQEFDQDFDFVASMAIDPTNFLQDELYAASYGHIYRSTDGGDSWTAVLGGGSNAFNEVRVSPTGVVYATLSFGDQAGIYRSTDGLAWTEITPFGPHGSLGRMVPAIDPNNENFVWFLSHTQEGDAGHSLWRYIYLSGDGSGSGGFWTDQSLALSELPSPEDTLDDKFQSYFGYTQMIQVMPSFSNTIFVGGVEMVRSSDGFTNNINAAWIGGWQYPKHHADLQSMQFDPGNPLIAYTGSDGGVHRTSNIMASRVVWQSRNNGYNTSQFYTVAIDPNAAESEIIVGGTQDNGSWWTDRDDDNRPWVSPLGGDGSFCAVADAVSETGLYYFSYQFGVIYRYRLRALGEVVEWTRVDPALSSGGLFINPFILDLVDPDIMYVASRDGIWRNDLVAYLPGFSDEPTAQGWELLTVQNGNVTSAMAQSRSERTLYYGTTRGELFRLASPHDANAPATPVTIGAGHGFPFNAYISSIAVDAADGRRVLLAFSNYNVSSLWFTEDGGVSWTAVEGNLGGPDGPSVRSVAIMPFDGSTLYFAGTSTGLYSATSLAGPATIWAQESPELIGNVVVDMLAARENDGTLVAATHGRGVFSINIPTGTRTPELEPARAQLHQNVPNPFNPRTSISFSLPRAGHVQLSVYDAAGRRVRQLVDESLAAGDHVRHWDGTDAGGRAVASGSYLYRLRAAGLEESRRMTLVR